MALTQIDLDEDALAEAMRLAGVKTKKETVNLALREYARHRRIEALEHYATLAAGWDYQTLRLPPEIEDQLKHVAEAEHRSVQQTVLVAIEEYLSMRETAEILAHREVVHDG